MAAPHLVKAIEQLETAETKAVEFQDALDGCVVLQNRPICCSLISYTCELETAVNTKDLAYDHIKDIVFSLVGF